MTTHPDGIPLSSAGTMRELLPAPIAVLECDVAASLGPLFAAEFALVGNAVASRALQFTAGRTLARRVLASLGAAQSPLAADADGVPTWPRGFIGCITHGAGRVAAAATTDDAVQALGIDMESIARFHEALEPQFLSDEEIRMHLAHTTPCERQARAAVLFCAKEAWFKCRFPVTRRRFGFHDAAVEVDWSNGEFVVIPSGAALPHAPVRGRSAVGAGIARAALVMFQSGY